MSVVDGQHEEPVYYQFCPMANNDKGANWLGQRPYDQNLYYGSINMTFGKTVER